VDERTGFAPLLTWAFPQQEAVALCMPDFNAAFMAQ
jgi:hypothetical protein